MKLVVTGSEGFLGRRLVERLVKCGHEVVAVDRVERTGEPNGSLFHRSDLSDPAGLLPPQDSMEQPFVLIHLAWDMRRYDWYGVQAMQVHRFACLLDAWLGRGVEHVISIGSAEEFGTRSGVLTEMDLPELPLSPYGWAKSSAKRLAQSWSMRNGIPVTWLRPFIMYGPGQRGDMLIPSAVEAAKSRQKTDFTDGRQQRDFVHVDDVVEAVAAAVERRLPGFQEFNLGRGEGVPVSAVLETIADKFGATGFFNIGARPRRPGEPDIQVAECSRARERLGWAAKINWIKGFDSLA